MWQMPDYMIWGEATKINIHLEYFRLQPLKYELEQKIDKGVIPSRTTFKIIMSTGGRENQFKQKVLFKCTTNQ
jgi:hypothetical protein